jgi:hypothetical protein
MSDNILIPTLTEALMYLVNNDPQTDHELAKARDKHEVLYRLTDEQIRDFAVEIDDRVGTMVRDAAEEFAQGFTGAQCRCRNPRCSFDVVLEENLMHHFPDPRLIETIGPNDTVPLGLCPHCMQPVYMPEIHPEDEVDAPPSAPQVFVVPTDDTDADTQARAVVEHFVERMKTLPTPKYVVFTANNPEWLADFTARALLGDKVDLMERLANTPARSVVDPQHQDQTQPPVEHCGCKYCVKKRCAQEGLTQDVTEALVAGASDSTGIPAEGSSDNTLGAEIQYIDDKPYGINK